MGWGGVGWGGVGWGGVGWGLTPAESDGVYEARWAIRDGLDQIFFWAVWRNVLLGLKGKPSCFRKHAYVKTAKVKSGTPVGV